MGSCVYHVARRGPVASVSTMGQDIELTNFSIALDEAREIAMERMQLVAAQAGAEGWSESISPKVATAGPRR